MKHRQPLGLLLYRCLLFLYPPAFRRRFGGDMLALVSALYTNRPAHTRASLLCSVYADMGISLIREWLALLQPVRIKRLYFAALLVGALMLGVANGYI